MLILRRNKYEDIRKNSLSAGVKVGLKVVLAIVIILEIALIAFSIITKANIIEEPKT